MDGLLEPAGQLSVHNRLAHAICSGHERLLSGQMLTCDTETARDLPLLVVRRSNEGFRNERTLARVRTLEMGGGRSSTNAGHSLTNT